MSGETNNRLKGKHTKYFLNRCSDVINELCRIIDEVDIMESCICLQSFHKISSILSVIFVDKYEKVKNFLPAGSLICASSQPSEVAEAIFDKYEVKAELLFTNGFMSFMEHTGNGEGETLYLHVLRHYIPKHM